MYCFRMQLHPRLNLKASFCHSLKHVNRFFTIFFPSSSCVFFFLLFIFFLIRSCSFFIFFLYPGFTFLFLRTYFHASLSVSFVFLVRKYPSFQAFSSFHSPFLLSTTFQVIPLSVNLLITGTSFASSCLIAVPSSPARAVLPTRWI